jgi:lipopolysaccharide/colanic/teichoic acid biosynthesis glycosyltransferase
MRFTNHFPWIHKESNTPPAKALPEPEFQRILAQERARADRNQHGFSMVSFSVPRISSECSEARVVVKEMDRRLRFTDVIGCLDSERITALLPETSRDGALVVEKSLRQAIEAKGAFVESQVDCHPSDGLVHITPKMIEAAASRRGQHLPQSGIPWWKRAMDVAGATLALLILSPLLVVVSLLIKLVSPGPIFYTQTRVGYLGKHFDCYKFRTMHANSDSLVHQQHIQQLIAEDTPLKKLDAQDSRIIPFGRVLRATAIDELAQLFNVLRGEMSLVGPRPDIPYAVPHYEAWNTRRFETAPGLTGLWQVSGKNKTTHTEMMRFDVRYVQQRSILFDVQIIFRTFPALVNEVRDTLFPSPQV